MLCLLRLSILLSKHIHTFLPITFLIHIPAHNFLNIQRIFNPQKSFGKLRLRAFQPYHQILYMSTLGISISNAFNAIYVNTVDTKHIHTFLPITFLIFNWFLICKTFWKAETQSFFNHTINTIYVNTVDTRQESLMHSMLAMSTLSIQFSHLIVLCIRCCERATNTSVNSVDKHSIKCITCFDLHIDSVDKQDTLLNTQ